MASITTHSDPYLTYVLSTEQSTVEIVPERGGIVTRWTWQGSEIFYLDEQRFQDPNLTVRGGIPILFPICGNLPDDRYRLNGQPYTLKQHGFARNLPWTVVDQSPAEGTAEEVSLTVELGSSEETFQSYPFDFNVQFAYILRGSTLTLRQTYSNHSDQTMPFMTGLHPYFAVQDKTQLQLGIPANQVFDHITQTSQDFLGTFDYGVDEIDVALAPLSATTATVTDPARNLQLSLSYSDHYSTLVFWTVKGKDFYCLEPWSGPRKSLISGDHLLHVAPESQLVTEVTMTINALT